MLRESQEESGLSRIRAQRTPGAPRDPSAGASDPSLRTLPEKEAHLPPTQSLPAAEAQGSDSLEEKSVGLTWPRAHPLGWGGVGLGDSIDTQAI